MFINILCESGILATTPLNFGNHRDQEIPLTGVCVWVMLLTEL